MHRIYYYLGGVAVLTENCNEMKVTRDRFVWAWIKLFETESNFWLRSAAPCISLLNGSKSLSNVRVPSIKSSWSIQIVKSWAIRRCWLHYELAMKSNCAFYLFNWCIFIQRKLFKSTYNTHISCNTFKLTF